MSIAIVKAIQGGFGEPASDAFGRARVSDPQTLFDSQSQYDTGPLLWQSVTAGGATVIHNANESAVDMTASASGSVAIRQTRQYLRYQPGKSQLILCTFVLDAQKTGLTQRVGYFDADDGIFCQLKDDTLSIVLRTSTSGSPVDTVVAQEDWNGEGFLKQSDFDITKAQIFWVDLEWLGVGQVRTGFVIDGKFKIAHTFKNANNVDKVYMKTANLPVRYEIRNEGAASSVLQAICCSVISEGGFEEDRGVPFAATNDVIKAVGASAIPIVSVRPKATFNSITNRSQILLKNIDGIAIGTDAVKVDLLYNGTLTGASFSSVNDQSVVDYDSSATSIAGGQVVGTLYLPAAGTPSQSGAGTGSFGLLSKLPLTIEASGSVESSLTAVAQAVGSAGSSANVLLTISWQEFK